MTEKQPYCYMQNRELSWMRYNERVLLEAENEEHPLLERLNFISIFSDNLHEFYCVRAARLLEQSRNRNTDTDEKTGMTAGEQLTKIFEMTKALCRKRDEIFLNISDKLSASGICHCKIKDLSAEQYSYVKDYFKNQILPVLSPAVIDGYHPFPFIYDRQPTAVFKLKNKKQYSAGLVPVPHILPETVILQDDTVKLITTAEIIIEFSKMIFDSYSVEDSACICLSRSADLRFDDEDFETDSNARSDMKKLIRKRSHQQAVSIEYMKCYGLGQWAAEVLQKKYRLKRKQMFETSAPFSHRYFETLVNKINAVQKAGLLYEPLVQIIPPNIDKSLNMSEQIQKNDISLFHPFESIAPFLRLLRESVYDDEVVSIKITVYRLAKKSRLVEYLCAAAENGINVTVVIELRARFDEQSNIDFSEQLEESGCKVFYGLDSFKTHAKLCVITKITDGKTIYLTHIGTGNYNEKTVSKYSDISLMTADSRIGTDALNFFDAIENNTPDFESEKLIFSPQFMKNTIINMIEKEICKGKKGQIIIKVNAVTDTDIIKKLREASLAGVRIKMIVRGICCLLPNIFANTENIEIISVIGRFLEHSRIYSFGKSSTQKLFISSADLMTRNLERRFEVLCPIEDISIKQKINAELEYLLNKNAGGSKLKSDGTYI